MTTRRVTIITLLAAICVVPGIAAAKLPTDCGAGSLPISGTVRNVHGDPLQGITASLRMPSQAATIPGGTAQTNGAGFYRICVDATKMSDTYDLTAVDSGGVYATAGAAVAMLADPLGDTNITMQYLLTESVLPVNAFDLSAPSSTQTVTFKIRSKAPAAGTTMLLRFGGSADPSHNGAASTLVNATPAGQESGWNVWTYTTTFGSSTIEDEYLATAYGLETATSKQVTQTAIEPYWVDDHAPIFGPATQPQKLCRADGFTPAATINAVSLISAGVCDPSPPGLLTPGSGLNPYSTTISIVPPPGKSVPAGQLTLNQKTIQFLPLSPWDVGVYQITFSVADYAGHVSSATYSLTVSQSVAVDNAPVIGSPFPTNLGTGCDPSRGNACGIVFGSQFTTPASRPVVSFYATDPDGQADLSWASLRVRIYGPDGKTLVYDYDPLLTACANVQQPCPANTGWFDQSSGRFEAGGFSMAGQPPGLYVAEATVNDRAGKSASLTWRWVLAAAA